MFYKVILAITFIISLMSDASLNASSSVQPEDEGLYKKAVNLRQQGNLTDAKEIFNGLLFSNAPELVRKSMHNLGTISYRQELYEEAACWFSSAAQFSLEKLKEIFQPSLNNLDTLRKLGLVSKEVSFIGSDSGSIRWNWSRRFLLKNGNTLNHRCNRIEITEGYGDIPKNKKLPTFIITEDIISLPDSVLAGIKLETLLVLSYNMTEENFETALRGAGLYVGENHSAMLAHITKFSYALGL